MRIPIPQLTEGRRAGLLASVAVYPLTRIAGTLPRPALDRAIVSGGSMALTYVSANVTSGIVRGLAARGEMSEVRRDLRHAVASAVVAAGAGVAAAQVRRRARGSAAEGHRLTWTEGAIGSGSEVVALSAAAGSAVAFADVLGGYLPDVLRPRNPALVIGGTIVAGAALAAVSRNPRVLAYFTLPEPDGGPDPELYFQTGATLPIAVGRAAGVAALTLAALTLETHAAGWLGALIDDSDVPGPAARLAGHGVVALAGAVVSLGGIAFYSSRVEVQEKLLESAYAAVPSRHGVTGGPDSVYDFAELGREGRRFISQAYSKSELGAVLGHAAAAPVRAFLPLSAQSGDPKSDAALLVAEVERLGGFAKGTIVLAAPTGDGYVSYVQTETVELLTSGDCTTAVVQYANVPSAIAFPKRGLAASAYAVHARAVAARARELNPAARLFTFGESLGSIVALDAFGPDVVAQLESIGFHGGLYVGVPIFSRTDRVLRPATPSVRVSRGLQYAPGRDEVLEARAGHLNLSHPSDPVTLADPSVVVRHPVDYWGRPHGAQIPFVSFLIELADVKNAMSLRPGEFTPSPGHDYRYETAAAVATAYGLPFDDDAEVVEQALRERELAWSVRRLIARRLGSARDTVVAQLQSWGVDPATVGTRFAAQREALPGWLDALVPDSVPSDDYDGELADDDLDDDEIVDERLAAVAEAAAAAAESGEPIDTENDGA
jgi:uncharacterized membrane protein